MGTEMGQGQFLFSKEQLLNISMSYYKDMKLQKCPPPIWLIFPLWGFFMTLITILKRKK